MDKLIRVYKFMFAALFAVVLIVLFVSQYQFSRQQSDSNVINIAGRQRMLSQRIAKLSLAIKSGLQTRDQDIAVLYTQLADAVTLFDESHAYLRFGDESVGFVPVYTDDIVSQYQEVSDYQATIVENAREILAMENTSRTFVDLLPYVDNILAAEQLFLPLMNAIVFAHDDHAQERLMYSRIIDFSSYAILLLFIVFFWYVQVVPVLRKSAEVDKAKTEFVSLASHQLRTPLTAINWFSELLLSGEVGRVAKVQKEHILQILHASQRMVALVNSLLNVSRIDLGTFSITSREFDIKRLARDVVDELKPQIDQKHLAFTVYIGASIDRYKGDKQLIRMIFQNLLSNAVKYTPEKGTVSLTVKKSVSTIDICVTDTGIGIPKQEQQQIFSKLFRANNAKESETEGTGLGLYIVKSVVDQTGGSIRFESASGQGTTFYVSLPLKGMSSKQGTKELVS